MEYKTEILQHVWKMQQISLLPKYIKLICTGTVYVHLHRQTLVIETFKCVCVYIYIYFFINVKNHTNLSMYKSNIQSIPPIVMQNLRNICFISHGKSAKNFLFLWAPECKKGAQSVYRRNVCCSKKCSNAKLFQSIGDRKMLPRVLYQLSHVNNVL